MSSREEILKKIKENKPQPTPVPSNYKYVTATEDTEKFFSDVLHAIGGAAVKVRVNGIIPVGAPPPSG